MKKTKIKKIDIIQNTLEERIDGVLAKRTQLPRTKIQSLIQSGMVKCNDQIVVKKNYKIPINCDVFITIELEDDVKKDKIINKINLPVNIVFEDEYILIINKDAGISVHPGAGNSNNTLINALIDKIDIASFGDSERPGIVHRIDKDTTGLMIVTKTPDVQNMFYKMFKNKEVERTYLAVVWGVVLPYAGTIDRSICRGGRNRQKMVIATDGNGKNAITHYKTLQILRDRMASLIECQLETGRTHQIRVHFASIGHKIVGDDAYGKKIKLKQKIPFANEINSFPRQALHSHSIKFVHPVTNELIFLKEDMPQDMLNLLNFFKKDRHLF